MHPGNNSALFLGFSLPSIPTGPLVSQEVYMPVPLGLFVDTFPGLSFWYGSMKSKVVL